MYELSSQSLNQIHGGTLQDDIVDEALVSTYLFLAWENFDAVNDAWFFGFTGAAIATGTALSNGLSGSTSALWGLAVGNACFQLGFVYSPGRVWNWV